MKAEVEIVTFHCLTEENGWEGETWYHYFLDEPGVLDVLQSIEIGDTDFDSLETVIMTWEEAERLTNQDHGEYMQAHWFGRLTKLKELRDAPSDALYKGGIRDYGEELFSYSGEETQL